MLEALGGLVSKQAETGRPTARLRFGTALMLMISYGAGVGGLLTPIGTPPNLIGIGFIEQATGTQITFFNWVLMAAPIVLAMFVVLCVVLLLLNRPEVRRISGAQEYITTQRSELAPLTRGEKNTLNWNEAAGIDGGTIVLFGAGIAIGTLMSETGFAEVSARASQTPSCSPA